jgi:ferric-dicitrate binding protein FerR (iron transport regulator)
MNERLLKKIAAEEPLDVAETMELERALENDPAAFRAMDALADARPSLAWRSALNERLASGAPRPRQRGWYWIGSLGAAAAAVAAVVLAPGPRDAGNAIDHDLETALVAVHDAAEAGAAAGVAGADWGG